jgi:aspartate ammonia-lyase
MSQGNVTHRIVTTPNSNISGNGTVNITSTGDGSSIDPTALNQIITDTINAVNAEIASSEARINAIVDQYEAVLNSARGVIAKSYTFNSTLVLNIKHDMGTVLFSETIINADNQRVYAPISIIDENEFNVNFTDVEQGTISVLFYINTL